MIEWSMSLFLGWLGWTVASGMSSSSNNSHNKTRSLSTRLLVPWKDCELCRMYHYLSENGNNTDGGGGGVLAFVGNPHEYSIDDDWMKLSMEWKRSLPLTELHQQLYLNLFQHDPATTVDAPVLLIHDHTLFSISSPSACFDRPILTTSNDTAIDDNSWSWRPLSDEYVLRATNDGENGNDSSSSTNNTTTVDKASIGYVNLSHEDYPAIYQKCLRNISNFILRPVPDSTGPTNPTAMKGYGVRLDIRNVEYKSHYLHNNNNNNTNNSDNNNDQHQTLPVHEVTIPEKGETTRLSKQAAHHLLESYKENNDMDLLTQLQELVWNLPTYAMALSKVQLTSSNALMDDDDNNTPPFMYGVYIQGRNMNILQQPSFNVYDFLKTLQHIQLHFQQSQRQLKPHLHTLLPLQTLLQMSTIQYKPNNDSDDTFDSTSHEQYYKPIRIDVGRGHRHAIWYWNDHEKTQDGFNNMDIEPSMEQWAWTIQMGAPLKLPKNLYTLLIVIDPLDTSSQQIIPILTQLQQFMQQQFSIRYGFLFINSQDMTANQTPQTSLTQTSMWLTMRISDLYGNMAALSFLQFLIMSVDDDDHTNMTEKDLLHLYINFFQSHGMSQSLRELEYYIDKQHQQQQQQHANNDNNKHKSQRVNYNTALNFAKKKNLKPNMIFFNGIPLDISSSSTSALQQTLLEETQYLFQKRDQFFGPLRTNKRSIYAQLLSKNITPNVYPKYHSLFIDTPIYIVPWSTDSFFTTTTNNNYFNKNPNKPKPYILYEAIIDLTTVDGLQLVNSFANICFKITTTVEATSFTDQDQKQQQPMEACRFVPANEATLQHTLAPFFFSSEFVLEENTWIDLEPLIQNAILKDSVSITIPSNLLLSDKEQQHWIKDMERKSNNIPDYLNSNNFIMVNGRVHVPNRLLKDQIRSDLEILSMMEIELAEGIWNHYQIGDVLTNPWDAVSRATAYLSKEWNDPDRGRATNLEEYVSYVDPDTVFFWNTENRKDHIQVTAILDPLTEFTQRVVPILLILRDQLHLPLTLVLAPTAYTQTDSTSTSTNRGIPLTSYYRFVLDKEEAFFDNLPTNHILTLRMDVPEQWDVQQTHSIQDTDNLECDANSCGDENSNGNAYHTSIEYGLKSLLFFGQCYDVSVSTPPNGLPLIITDAIASHSETSFALSSEEIQPDGSIHHVSINNKNDKKHHSDTTVMKTVGYWQLQANPGVWTLKIDPESRGAQIYDMVQGKVGKNGRVILDKNTNADVTKTLLMKDFESRGELLLVKRKPGFEREELFPLIDESNSNNRDSEHFDKIHSDDDVVHVFSLATGHLYERFLKIMMLSVTKRTSTRVKFWLFENYLSPSFKASAIDMAKRIGCEVAFVTYKWPNWLRGQKEKQRIIWGYKILFLDVLFPLDVKKIIYVDADQVVRGDLKELWDLDLEGAPYGYTPMCSSRKETLGYQFWRTGFWENHLKGKPYHISALYVVDLQRFRREKVGDTLRQYYQNLSADPNSLSNLDQDLPNYVQFEVKIHSLPQEWLWCESWCSDETKVHAKTIDLCNNPEHKEPKVLMAKRIISGDLFPESWVELDAEVDKYEKIYLASLQSTKISNV